ncbi:hypothetical protein PR048_011089 [Dryococelus australis]|uniref:Uncharacterized protein n=1 Tax=Dryococelus australis TaxID=614101 RepID=A0ABQ9HKL0_9NEOP|nr:hypothetical protein PR048_011089 [Dryococelus australis]
MFFPQFVKIIDPATETSPFDDLKKLHSPKSQSLVKFGFGLTLKALNPTNLEKQNAKPVLQVFMEYRNLPTYNETKAYIEIMLRWWKIMNVKHPNKGTRMKDK